MNTEWDSKVGSVALCYAAHREGGASHEEAEGFVYRSAEGFDSSQIAAGLDLGCAIIWWDRSTRGAMPPADGSLVARWIDAGRPLTRKSLPVLKAAASPSRLIT